jgi:hypothetical protein
MAKKKKKSRKAKHRKNPARVAAGKRLARWNKKHRMGKKRKKSKTKKSKSSKKSKTKKSKTKKSRKKRVNPFAWVTGVATGHGWTKEAAEQAAHAHHPPPFRGRVATF